jgi:hypothetical protein
MYIYRTYFRLTDCVNDVSAAQEYLTEDDMTKYLKGDNRIPENVRNAAENIEWILKDEQSGYIELKLNTQLSDNELQYISEWVSGQNSDGLGESFEQQDFANYCDEGLQGYEDEDWDDEWIMASFDWETNDYKFEFIRNE